MSEIIPVLSRLRSVLSATTVRRLGRIVSAVLCMSGPITQRSISRWTDRGGKYRTVQRFFQSDVDWSAAEWEFFRSLSYDPASAYILVGDETVVGKAGKKTYGMDRFYSSTMGKPVAGLAFFGLALVNVKTGQAHPLSAHQVIRSAAEKAEASARREARKTAKKKGSGQQKEKKHPGRPAGSKNKNKTEVVLSPELVRTSEWIAEQLARMGATLPVVYLALDGHYGNNAACQMVRRHGLHLISKLRYDAELYLLPTEEEKEEHPKRKYGPRLDYGNLPGKHLISSVRVRAMRLDTYQMPCRHKDFPDVLNVVVLVATDTTTGRSSRTVLFSTDVDLDAETLIKYYSLRFKIEFVFRDAKQHWGLEDFMGVTQRAVTNAVGLSFFLVNLSDYLLQEMRQRVEEAGVSDLKSAWRAQRYVQEVRKYITESPDPIDWERLAAQVSLLGLIHEATNIHPAFRNSVA